MFEYSTAFSRNIGWITEAELAVIKKSKIGVAGLGGSGGEHCLTLARMGFENFHISDFDEFEIHNFNRQAGAYVSTLNRPKCEVLAEMIKDINPLATVKQFPKGVNADNVHEFFDELDIYVDGIDFFALDARKLVYSEAEKRGIPNLLAAPLGMSAALVCFDKDSMGYEEYYRFSTCKDKKEACIKLLMGLAPSATHRNYLVDESTADFDKEKGPSTPMAIKLCSGLLVTQVIKLVLGRGKVYKAPYSMQVDAYNHKYKISKIPFGNNGPIQRIKYAMVKKLVSN
ncbi:ThiF family adenylyltransferase [Agaribacter flavus]|uniref:ThiF family adenylyltransferase n=1 Tax=Agaribacter flavus TaxID=1902781 RepID=A0ABV7FTX7_9ALTE